MAALSNLPRKALLSLVLTRNGRISSRQITTSEKKKESSETCPSPDMIYKKVPDFSKPLENKNWVSFGYSHDDRIKDTYMAHFSTFCICTIIICGMGFLYAYSPDRMRRDWAKREAFIRLHEREQLGLDPVDPNYVDPSKIVLPPDEELSDDDIII